MVSRIVAYFSALYIFCAVLFPGQSGKLPLFDKRKMYLKHLPLSNLCNFFIYNVFFTYKNIAKVVVAVPILLVFIPFENIDFVGPGVAKQPLHPTVEPSCNVSTKLKSTRRVMLINCKNVVFCQKLQCPPSHIFSFR